ncbi:MAG: Gfo/Idh/MocA family oxidoreductase [Flavobacteriaceae bacterium]|jgi:predicted dehydrogenase|nr:Gfo/Idh/MocA family oxidoreductase [Flavobacteriaceae bacterium]
MKKKSRRNFIKKSSLIGSGIFIVPRNVLGGVGFVAPSDQLNIGAIGAGGKGSDIRESWASKERVVALCDVHPLGKHGVIQSRKKYPNAKFYVDFNELLDKEKDLDAVTINTPDHTHGVIGNRAMNKGLHVYIQKPLTHNIEEARQLTITAKKNKVITQMGNQGGSCIGVERVKEWIDTKKIGDINKVYAWTDRPVWPQGFKMPEPSASKPEDLEWDLWLGPAKEMAYRPEFHPFNWRGWWNYGTGALGDMGCHILDLPVKALNLGYPKDVECSVAKIYEKMWSPNYYPEGPPAASLVTLHFKKNNKTNSDLELVWMDGGIIPPRPEVIPAEDYLGEKGNTNGVLIIGKEGVISSGVYGLNPKLYRKGKKTLHLNTDKIYNKNNGLDHIHHKEWIDAIKGGYGSKEYKKLTAPIEYAGPFTETVLIGNIALRSYMIKDGTDFIGRKKLLWDGENTRITNFDLANKFVGRVRRPGWDL